MESDQCEFSLEIFRHGRAILDPIPAIDIQHVAQIPDFRSMNVATDDTGHAILSRILDHGVFVIGHVFHGRLGFQFDERGKRPVPKPKQPSHPVYPHV